MAITPPGYLVWMSLLSLVFLNSAQLRTDKNNYTHTNKLKWGTYCIYPYLPHVNIFPYTVVYNIQNYVMGPLLYLPDECREIYWF